MNDSSMGGKTEVKGFLVLSRLPFLLPGLAALITGMAIGVADGYDPAGGLAFISVTGVAMIMLATYYFNEYFDYEGDLINRKFIPFSGGSRALPDLKVPRKTAIIAGRIVVAILVVYLIIYLLFYLRDYPMLLFMGLFGAFCGIFYSHTPFQWSYRGIGEPMIGFCYGILALTSGYYVVSGVLKPSMLVIAIPASLSIFAVIVCNEFPDIQADRAVHKLNLVVRLGLEKASVMYAIVMGLLYPTLLMSIAVGVDWRIAIAGLPVLILSAMAVIWTARGGYADRPTQIKISGVTLLANLLSSLMFIPVVMLW